MEIIAWQRWHFSGLAVPKRHPVGCSYWIISFIFCQAITVLKKAFLLGGSGKRFQAAALSLKKINSKIYFRSTCTYMRMLQTSTTVVVPPSIPGDPCFKKLSFLRPGLAYKSMEWHIINWVMLIHTIQEVWEFCLSKDAKTSLSLWFTDACHRVFSFTTPSRPHY